MRVVVYPSDQFGCGSFRAIWPGEACAAMGMDVTVVQQKDRRVRLVMEGDVVRDVLVDADVVVLQRTTHAFMAQAVGVMRAKGITVVVDVDDDLSSIHPSNPAWETHRPGRGPHSWQNLAMACRDASLVTVSTPALLGVYARHGRGYVLPNYLPDHYYGLERRDSDVIGWPASFHSHPNDPEVVGGAVSRMVEEGAQFVMRGDSTGAGRALGLQQDPRGYGVPIEAWPSAVAELGIGIAPLADTKFNAAKSWLKPLEMSACGVPWVASPRAEYRRLHDMGAGVLVDQPRRWYRQLKRLHQSAAYREELSQAGLEVAERLRLKDNAWRWMDAWERAATLDAEDRRRQVVC